MSQLSDQARQYRSATRASALAALLGLAAALGATRGWVPPAVAVVGVLLFAVAGALAALLGLQARRQALADREKQQRMSMILLAAAQLGKQDDATLERIARGGGLPGDAARMILEGRRSRPGRPERHDPLSAG